MEDVSKRKYSNSQISVQKLISPSDFREKFIFSEIIGITHYKLLRYLSFLFKIKLDWKSL